VRVTAPLEVILRRLQQRDPGSKTVGSLQHLREFDELISAAALEHDIIENLDPDPSSTARRIATMAGWIRSAT
jgi:hypothetical protein